MRKYVFSQGTVKVEEFTISNSLKKVKRQADTFVLIFPAREGSSPETPTDEEDSQTEASGEE